ncbi:MAG: hypothetical protein KDJ72_11885 [Methyloceanibacter sp.]|uniref:hypothetical protein n=1 Tax=Methyloceanibacter sp. TaxID=1965321 RepID=UPI001D4B5EA7|nr:hypothetical protein [Methyloceanibacter sp.]MCB1443711.1 hypothetical protein [Methyloceanibacter sp.]MCC0059713.1 hypothetical protein [Hyphomicrobiaceae bacterium]
MTVIKSHLILATLFAALVCGTVAISPNSAEAGPRWTGGFMDLSGTDLGSSR